MSAGISLSKEYVLHHWMKSRNNCWDGERLERILRARVSQHRGRGIVECFRRYCSFRCRNPSLGVVLGRPSLNSCFSLPAGLGS